MKKLKLYTAFLLLLSILAATSCKKELEELNVNPNNSTNATPDQLIGPGLYEMLTVNLNRSHRINGDFMQVHVPRIDGDDLHRYVIRPNESDYMWNNWYLRLTNFKDIYNSAEVLQSNAYKGISLILQAWTYSLITDTYGDAPFSESNMGKERILSPKFDTQRDIYAGIFTALDSANTLLKTPGTLTLDQIKLDVLYGRSVDANTYALNWRKFGNALFLRLLMRVSAKPDAIANGKSAADKIKEIAESNKSNYPLFANNEESAILRYTGVAPVLTPFALWRDYDWNGTISLSQFFVNNLKEWSDPRLTKWATVFNGSYEGIESGYEVTKVPDARSTYPVGLKTEPLLGNIINYPEVQFILAEAALKGYISGDPKTYYETGVNNAITMWGYTVPANYLSTPDIMWDPAISFDLKMDKIMLQKYYTLFFTDFQQWFEYRRTGHPVLPKGPGLRNNGEMPSRLYYPVYLQSLNRANYNAAIAAQGPDDINTKVWWDK
jgi:hypothetical protein